MALLLISQLIEYPLGRWSDRIRLHHQTSIATHYLVHLINSPRRRSLSLGLELLVELILYSAVYLLTLLFSLYTVTPRLLFGYSSAETVACGNPCRFQQSHQNILYQIMFGMTSLAVEPLQLKCALWRSAQIWHNGAGGAPLRWHMYLRQ